MMETAKLNKQYMDIEEKGKVMAGINRQIVSNVWVGNL